MTRFIEAWAQGIVRFRAAILALTLLLLILSPLSFSRLYHDDSNESYFLEHDPNLTSFNQLVEHFGDNEYLLIGIRARPGDADVFTADTVRVIAELTDFLDNHPLVTQVRSLSKYQYTHDDGGLLATDELFEDVAALNEQPEVLNNAREIMQGEQLALGSLITEDLQNTLIAARTVYRPGENNHKVEIVTDVRDFIAKQGYAQQGYTLHMSGVPVIGERFQTLTQRDMAWINPVMAVLMTGILFAIFRSLFATLLPFLLIGGVVLVTTGAQGWLRWPFTAVNSALIPTIIILSIGTSIHVLVEFFHFRRRGVAPQDAAIATTRDLLFPVFFTCLTTAVGFFTLSVTELAPVRQFALLAAGAAMLIFFLSMTSLPALLSYIPWIARGNSHPGAAKTNLLTRLLQMLPDFTLRKRKWIAVVGTLISVFSVFSISQMVVDTNIVNYFKRDSWVSRDLTYFDQTFSGISNLEFIVDTGSDGGVKDPVVLQRVDDLQTWLENLEETGRALSIIKFYKQINQALNNDDPAFFALPSSPEMAAQFLLLYENTGPDEDLSDLKDFAERRLRVSIPIINMDARDMTVVLQGIQDHIAKNFSDLNMEITGTLVMNNAQNRYVNNGMFQSFGIAILVIGLSFFLLFRSLKYGLIALIPSIVPVLLTGGLVSMAGIAMDLGTMIVGAMTIGIAVDDSIHLMSRYLLRRRRGDSVIDAIRSAFSTSGKAVILTSIILVCGFSVMLLGSFVSYIYVGLFSAMIMSFALIGDLLFMPALLFLFDKEKQPETRDHTGTTNVTHIRSTPLNSKTPEEITHA
jgi:predicted RND superfamily exporter protein